MSFSDECSRGRAESTHGALCRRLHKQILQGLWPRAVKGEDGANGDVSKSVELLPLE